MEVNDVHKLLVYEHYLQKCGYHTINNTVTKARNFFFLCIVHGRWQLTQSHLIQIYSVDWTDVYDTHNIKHRTEPLSH